MGRGGAGSSVVLVGRVTGEMSSGRVEDGVGVAGDFYQGPKGSEEVCIGLSHLLVVVSRDWVLENLHGRRSTRSGHVEEQRRRPEDLEGKGSKPMTREFACFFVLRAVVEAAMAWTSGWRAEWRLRSRALGRCQAGRRIEQWRSEPKKHPRGWQKKTLGPDRRRTRAGARVDDGPRTQNERRSRMAMQRPAREEVVGVSGRGRGRGGAKAGLIFASRPYAPVDFGQCEWRGIAGGWLSGWTELMLQEHPASCEGRKRAEE